MDQRVEIHVRSSRAGEVRDIVPDPELSAILLRQIFPALQILGDLSILVTLNHTVFVFSVLIRIMGIAAADRSIADDHVIIHLHAYRRFQIMGIRQHVDVDIRILSGCLYFARDPVTQIQIHRCITKALLLSFDFILLAESIAVIAHTVMRTILLGEADNLHRRIGVIATTLEDLEDMVSDLLIYFFIRQTELVRSSFIDYDLSVFFLNIQAEPLRMFCKLILRDVFRHQCMRLSRLKGAVRAFFAFT